MHASGCDRIVTVHAGGDSGPDRCLGARLVLIEGVLVGKDFRNRKTFRQVEALGDREAQAAGLSAGQGDVEGQGGLDLIKTIGRYLKISLKPDLCHDHTLPTVLRRMRG